MSDIINKISTLRKGKRWELHNVYDNTLKGYLLGEGGIRIRIISPSASLAQFC
jgi:hypothetical protein